MNYYDKLKTLRTNSGTSQEQLAAPPLAGNLPKTHKTVAISDVDLSRNAKKAASFFTQSGRDDAKWGGYAKKH